MVEGVYVQGKVNGHPITITADTGALRTIISTRAFNQLQTALRPQLDRSARLVGANSAPIKDAGEATMDLELGPLLLAEHSRYRRRSAAGVRHSKG